MDAADVDRLVTQLSAGFEALQDEYHQLHNQHQSLERKLKNAREQYNELAKLYGSEQTTTPPLSLSSSPALTKEDTFAPHNTPQILESESKQEAADKVRAAIAAANTLKRGLPTASDSGATHGVKIWSGPSADRPDGSSSMMPSIAESPLEQDFTVEGKPSQLGCPFASMARKKLSSHAASVLSRYNQNGSVGTASTPPSNASRVNGKESFSRRQSRRASFADPIKAEICGMSDHGTTSPLEKAPSVKATSRGPTERQLENAEVGVCPIRFLDQHSPEEVATYFENHKHELPRSHEVCVMRYQSNEEQIKQLDEKYGNLVSMIQGLGQKHKEMLPEEPADADEDEDGIAPDRQSDEKIRKWASSVSAQAPEAGVEEESEDRLPHFERPVRDIRVGESPSRPWGIHIPAQYLDKAGDGEQESEPAQVNPATVKAAAPQPEPGKKPGKCPFDHAALKAMGVSAPDNPHKPVMMEPATKPKPAAAEDGNPHPRFTTSKAKADKSSSPHAENKASPPIIINGPVFIGYSPQDAIRILRESGLKMSQ